jgi:hypothetical protein
MTPPEALERLVAQLTAAGWERTGVGARPWELWFERYADAPVEPERSA